VTQKIIALTNKRRGFRRSFRAPAGFEFSEQN
jgi:hypothetical protein